MDNVHRLGRTDWPYAITVAQTRGAEEALDKLLSPESEKELIDFLAFNPETGVVIPGTGGLRKMRWAGQGKGKSKGLRIIYFYHDLNIPLFILAVYSKGETLRITKKEEQSMARVVDSILSEYRRRWRTASESAG